MGMFDDYIVDLECPYCHVFIASFQGKDGPCGLREFHPGDRMTDYDEKPIWDGVMELHEICGQDLPGNSHWVQGLAIVHEGVWIATIIIEVTKLGNRSDKLWQLRSDT